MFLSTTLLDPFGTQRELLRRGRYGVIETAGGRLVAIHLRRWPKIASALESEWWGRRHHERHGEDRCWLYYNQPLRHPNFLALTYILSGCDTSLASFRRAVQTLDEVARVKRTDALVCDAWNLRISARLFARWGWEPHKPQRWHRNYIKRFYGEYPAPLFESPAETTAERDAELLAV